MDRHISFDTFEEELVGDMNHRIDNFTESNFNSGFNKKLGFNSGYNKNIDKQLAQNELIDDTGTILACYS